MRATCTVSDLARDLHATGPDGDRLFDYVLTYDRSVVTTMAQALMARAFAHPGP